MHKDNFRYGYIFFILKCMLNMLLQRMIRSKSKGCILSLSSKLRDLGYNNRFNHFKLELGKIQPKCTLKKLLNISQKIDVKAL